MESSVDISGGPGSDPSSRASAATPAPGWYPSPSGIGHQWWDGRAWDLATAGGGTFPGQQPPDDASVEGYLEDLATRHDLAFDRLRVGAWALIGVACASAVGGVLAGAALLGRTRYLLATVLIGSSLAIATALVVLAWWALAYVADRELEAAMGDASEG